MIKKTFKRLNIESLDKTSSLSRLFKD